MGKNWFAPQSKERAPSSTRYRAWGISLWNGEVPIPCEYETWLERHSTDFNVVFITKDTAAIYANLLVGLSRRVRPIPANDTWIAALALQHRLAARRLDTHFDSVPELILEFW
jgi:hypothetical protein